MRKVKTNNFQKACLLKKQTKCHIKNEVKGLFNDKKCGLIEIS